MLRSQGFLVLRPCNPNGEELLTNGRRDVARVALAAGTAGPLGGDDFTLDVHVGAGSTLLLTEISAMLVLPGSRRGRSTMRIAVRDDEDATFVWMPKPIIAARGCGHDHDVRISLERNARMVMREEAILGRHTEEPGNFRTTLQAGLHAVAQTPRDCEPALRVGATASRRLCRRHTHPPIDPGPMALHFHAKQVAHDHEQSHRHGTASPSST